MIDHTEKFDDKRRIPSDNVGRLRQFEVRIVNYLQKFYIVDLKGCDFSRSFCDWQSVEISFIQCICLPLGKLFKILERINIDRNELNARINLGKEILGSRHIDLLVIKHYIIKKTEYRGIFLELLYGKVPDRQFISHELKLLQSLYIHCLCRYRMIKKQNNLIMR